MRRPAGAGASAQDPAPLDPGALDPVEDLDDLDDLDDPLPGPAPRRPGRPVLAGTATRHQRFAGACAVAALAALSVLAAGRHVDHSAALAAAAEQAQRQASTALQAASREQQQRATEHRTREARALELLPADLALDQRVVQQALDGAASSLPDLAWSTGRTSTRRDGFQRTADGDPVLVDAARFARVVDPARDPGDDRAVRPARVPVVEGQLIVVPPAAGWPATGVGWRITTPLRPKDLSDPCAVAGAVPPLDVTTGLPSPQCSLRTFTSPSGEQQVVAVRSWERLVDGPGDARPARVEVVHLAVLVTDGRWVWSVGATAVGVPGTPGALPPMSLDQTVLATRWLADAARGLPTPAPAGGTPLPGFSG